MNVIINELFESLDNGTRIISNNAQADLFMPIIDYVENSIYTIGIALDNDEDVRYLRGALRNLARVVMDNRQMFSSRIFANFIPLFIEFLTWINDNVLNIENIVFAVAA